MKVVNKSKAIVYVGGKVIEPEKTAELTKEELEMSGVKALLNAGELEIVSENKESKKNKRKRA